MSTSVCDSGHLMPVDEAIATLLAQAPPPPATQVIGLEQALGRVIAEELFSPLDLPGFDNSAMDGYALRAEDVPVNQVGHLIQDWPGASPPGSTAPRTCRPDRRCASSPAHHCRPARTRWCPRNAVAAMASASGARRYVPASTCASRVKNCAAARP